MCDRKNDTMWEPINEDHMIKKTLNLFSSLVLEDQPQGKMVYRCKAKNFLGADQILYNILKVQGRFKWRANDIMLRRPYETKKNHTFFVNNT